MPGGNNYHWAPNDPFFEAQLWTKTDVTWSKSQVDLGPKLGVAQGKKPGLSRAKTRVAQGKTRISRNRNVCCQPNTVATFGTHQARCFRAFQLRWKKSFNGKSESPTQKEKWIFWCALFRGFSLNNLFITDLVSCQWPVQGFLGLLVRQSKKSQLSRNRPQNQFGLGQISFKDLVFFEFRL